MSIWKRLKEKIVPEVRPLDPKPELLSETSTVLPEEPEPVVDEKYRIPVGVGEYFPWKGHLFQIKEVNALSFKAQCIGLTKRRSEKLRVVR